LLVTTLPRLGFLQMQPASMPASQIAVCTETQIAVCTETFGLPMASLETRGLLKHARRLLKNAVV